MEDTKRYYLTQLSDGAWKITLQDNSSGEWTDTETEDVYQTWEEALKQPITIAFNPQPDWPKELGGENG